MDMSTVLDEVDSWPVEDRLKLVEQVWDRLIDRGDGPELTDELRAELDHRLVEDDAAPNDVVSWEVVKAEALARIKR